MGGGSRGSLHAIMIYYGDPASNFYKMVVDIQGCLQNGSSWNTEEYLALSYIIMYYLDLSSIKSCGAAMSCFHLLSTSFICFHLLSPKPPSLSLNWQEKSTNNKIIQKSIINHSVSTCKILQVSYHWQWLAEPFCSEFMEIWDNLGMFRIGQVPSSTEPRFPCISSGASAAATWGAWLPSALSSK